MRGLGLIGLVLALVIVGLLVKKQMTGMASSARPAVAAPAAGDAPVNARDQAQQVQQQVKEALDAAAKTRQMPDDN